MLRPRERVTAHEQVYSMSQEDPGELEGAPTLWEEVARGRGVPDRVCRQRNLQQGVSTARPRQRRASGDGRCGERVGCTLKRPRHLAAVTLPVLSESHPVGALTREKEVRGDICAASTVGRELVCLFVDWFLSF